MGWLGGWVSGHMVAVVAAVARLGVRIKLQKASDCSNDAALHRSRCQRGRRMVPKWPQDGRKIGPKWCQDHSKPQTMHLGIVRGKAANGNHGFFPSNNAGLHCLRGKSLKNHRKIYVFVMRKHRRLGGTRSPIKGA